MIDKDDGIERYVRTSPPEEAKDFHKLFIMSFIIFTVIAIVAHFLVWHVASVAARPERLRCPDDHRERRDARHRNP